MRQPPRPADGHSLLDALVVLSVLGIFLSLAAPDLGQAHRRYAASGAARQLRADLASARMEAVLAGTTVTVTIDTLAGTYEASGGDGRSILDRALPAAVRIRTSAHDGAIPFTARGTTNLYSTTWIGPADDPGGRWHGLQVAPSGALTSR